ncbi:hypothetical protein P29A0810_197 [Synechococcus phage S-CAM8]|jgi:hypothetical protein|uniref:Uncharacterized protein n=1 Tax=Synechococcus phage S-CAM8 TaxID=754038 RepID=G8EXZ2_9CAUD|nr:hypothetical protein SXCG_00093 [Synechococcus phage S-CAM8]AET72682.1 hypothetical protein SXFG_00132 [Synechococcus phage S-CAM8]AGN34035.1 hypothetical protein SXCG_00093 [Synechococcus phage S-CAM8]AOV60133.1 hypothetical protein P29A0810_197 [Synechococcus phage S-CAM8]
MDLPKIKNENLPEELRKILGDDDAEFDAIVNPADIIGINAINSTEFEDERLKIAHMLINSRKKLEDFRFQSKKQYK